MFFKSTIQKFDRRLNMSEKKSVIYRVINFGNVYFFAQEISTGCIFPTYSFSVPNGKNDYDMRFRNYSYLKSGKYFLYYPIAHSEKIFEYSLNEDSLKKDTIDMPSVKEVNAYLKEKKKDKDWINMLKEMEAQNEYMCDLSLIKEKIAMLRDDEYTLSIDFNNAKVECAEYLPSIDLKNIEDFGYDLSEQDNLCNLVGREKEKKKIIKATAIRKSSVILIGESGSGKTSILESLALDIKNKRNEWLNDKVIFCLDLTNLIADTKYTGEFQKKILKFINFCKENCGRIIIFIDEIHNLYGLGRVENSSIDAMNILKPYISKGDITIIGATTEKEYQEYMANDPAFLGRFEEVRIYAPDKNMNIQIIISYINELQNKYKIKLNVEENIIHNIADFIIEATDTTHQKVIGINKVINPKISKNIIEEAFAEAVYNGQEVVTIDDICYAILSCDKFSPSYRKEIAEKLKNKILETLKVGDKEAVKDKTKTLILAK